jgi:hypothetical protein
MIVPALANLEDILRLEKLERDGLMPAGTTAMATKQAMAYLWRIGELIETSHGQRVPKVS